MPPPPQSAGKAWPQQAAPSRPPSPPTPARTPTPTVNNGSTGWPSLPSQAACSHPCEVETTTCAASLGAQKQTGRPELWV